MKINLKYILIFFTILLLALNLFADDRFPKPEFETDYQQPQTTTPQPDSVFWNFFDIAYLFIGMSPDTTGMRQLR